LTEAEIERFKLTGIFLFNLIADLCPHAVLTATVTMAVHTGSPASNEDGAMFLAMTIVKGWFVEKRRVLCFRRA
jgi:hypothetical protein